MNMLRSIREKKGLTVSQLAARASISARLLADYEEGRQPLPLAHAKLLAKALWVNIEDLLPPAGATPPQDASAPPTPPPPQHPPAMADSPRPTQERGANRPAQDGSARESAVRNGKVVRESGEAYRAPADSQPTGEARPPRQPRAKYATLAATEGQIEELLRLSARLEIPQNKLEERTGKSLTSLTRVEAREWIKRLRAMADELAPAPKVNLGRWPAGQEDREATYLREQCDAAAPFMFKLFNGEEFTGRITDFTPYTITVNLSKGGEEMVLRKLALAYYRRLPTNDTQAESEAAAEA